MLHLFDLQKVECDDNDFLATDQTLKSLVKMLLLMPISISCNIKLVHFEETAVKREMWV